MHLELIALENVNPTAIIPREFHAEYLASLPLDKVKGKDKDLCVRSFA